MPRDGIRALTLTPGMKVEARYGGGLDYYPGVIDGVNTRCVSDDDSRLAGACASCWFGLSIPTTLLEWGTFVCVPGSSVGADQGSSR